MDRLFLLNPGFKDLNLNQSHRYYCPHCAMIEGILQYYPHLKEELDIDYVDFARPRMAVVELLGEENQGCPVLIIHPEENPEMDLSYFKRHEQLLFIDSAELIARYLAVKFGIALPHP
jgi:Protein of unknown function (DUF3088)